MFAIPFRSSTTYVDSDRYHHEHDHDVFLEREHGHHRDEVVVEDPHRHHVEYIGNRDHKRSKYYEYLPTVLDDPVVEVVRGHRHDPVVEVVHGRHDPAVIVESDAPGRARVNVHEV